MPAAKKRCSGIPMEIGEEEKVMEGKTVFSWEAKICHVGSLHPAISKLCELEHWLHLAWWQNFILTRSKPGLYYSCLLLKS